MTGGNSAIYGSDAIAGVVNFVLRRDFDGAPGPRAGARIQRRFGANQYVSAMWGITSTTAAATSPCDGEYSHQDRVFASDIPSSGRQHVPGRDVDPAGLPNGSDGSPTRLLPDVRSASINPTGLVPITQPASNPLCGIGLGCNERRRRPHGRLPYNCTLHLHA